MTEIKNAEISEALDNALQTVERIYSRDEMLNAIERIEWLVLHLRHHHGCIHTNPEFSGIMKWVKEIKV